MNPRKYASAEAFRIALETRLQRLAVAEGMPLMRLRRQFTFDRFLCRIFRDETSVILKGGYAIELRLANARTTKDIDLCMNKVRGTSATPQKLQSFFQAKASLQLGDYLEFTISSETRSLTNAAYGGSRFSVEANMAGRRFAMFSIDVSFGDGWIEDQDLLESRDWLAFAGVRPFGFPSTTVEQQLAEKIHSYTLPRQRPNSRVKDLVDIVLLTQNFKVNPGRMAASLSRTFKIRKTHSIPTELRPPPAAWENVFSRLAGESELKIDLSDAFAHLKDFYHRFCL